MASIEGSRTKSPHLMLRRYTGAKMNTQSSQTIVEVKDLKMYFPITRGLLRRKVGDIKSVDGVSFQIKTNETLGLVGESGCGKTTIGRCILRLYKPTSGKIIFKGTDITQLPERKIRPLRVAMSSIFQDPYGSLNPRKTAGSIVGAPLLVHHMVPKNEINNRVAEIFRLVGLDPNMVDRVPHEFSGGQRQRLGIARALACQPSLIVCDEPISALDVSIQAQIINLLEELQEKLGLTYLFIAHDLAVVQHISNRIAVMYLGRIVEIADSEELYQNPLHPYTQALLSAIPIPDPELDKNRHRIILKGEVPSPANPPKGCHFNPRCFYANDECRVNRPPLREFGKDHFVACIRS
jgi:oligopeptide/dipeptide ABC transporter ATP-binding protein